MAQHVCSFTVATADSRKEAEKLAREYMECMGYPQDDSFTSSASHNTTWHVARNIDVSVWFYERDNNYNVTFFRFVNL